MQSISTCSPHRAARPPDRRPRRSMLAEHPHVDGVHLLELVMSIKNTPQRRTVLQFDRRP